MQYIKSGFEPDVKIRGIMLVILILLFCFMELFNCEWAVAKSDSSEAATELVVVLNDNGVASELNKYTIDELKSMPQVEREYSSIDSMPAPVFTAGKGIDLETFLLSQGIEMNSISYIKFYATDDLVKKIDRYTLLERNAYYYPKIVESWDNYWDENAHCYKDNEIVTQGAIPVKAMLAISSSQERFLSVPDWSNLDSTSCLRLCLGQVSPEENINMNFVKWINKIEVFGKLRSGGGASPLNPKVTLSSPAVNASYRAGDKVDIRGTVENHSSLSLSISDPDGYEIYTVFDIEVSDGRFSNEYVLKKDAIPGNYSIEIGPELGSNLSSKLTFLVTGAPAITANITLITPQAGQIFKPEDKVIISGTVHGLDSAILQITAPDKQSIYSSNIDKSGEFSREFTLPREAEAGDYSIQFAVPELKQDCSRVFKVAKREEKKPESKVDFSKQVVNVAPYSSFSDIDKHWAGERIKQLLARGAISGYPDGSFKPDSGITRAEFTTVLVKAFNLSNLKGKAFTDTSGHWAQDYIAIATAAGIVGGYNDRTFGPDDPITREQMAVMVVKAAGLTLVTEENNFRDSNNIAEWARRAVATAVKSQVIKGYPDNSFKPLGNASRAEAVTVIAMALKL